MILFGGQSRDMMEFNGGGRWAIGLILFGGQSRDMMEFNGGGVVGHWIDPFWRTVKGHDGV